MKLPTVSGSNLNRQKLSFPKEFVGDVNLVFIAFQQWHQDLINEWVPLAEQLEKTITGFHYYEFPVVYQMGWMGRTFLNEGMRAGIPNPATRARTITLYLEKSDFRAALDIPDESTIWAYLFDRDGNVLWRISGKFSEEKGMALETAVTQLLQSAPV
jgi:hypothetical protein